MSKIKVNLPDYPVNGKQISFIAPCASTYTECFIINNVRYSVVDADGVSVAGIPNVWNSGAMVSAILNVDTKTAFIQNANTNTYMEGQFQTQTHKLKSSNSLTREDTIPFYSQRDNAHGQVTLAVLKEILGVESAIIDVTTCQGAEVICTNGETTLTSTGPSQFNLPKNGIWTVTATLGGKTANVTVEATGSMKYNVDLMILGSITITSYPTKAVYFDGEPVDTSGLKVTATYADGATEDVTDGCTINPTVVAADTTAITVSYANAGLSATATFPITVSIVLSEIAVTTPPAKTRYFSGDTFDTNGMVVTATYTDGSTKPITGYICNPTTITFDTLEIIISYTEDGVTCTTTQAVAVAQVSSTLADNSWDTIRKVSDSGQAANYWSVGDVKPVTINGKVGDTTFTDLTLDAFIIGFDHNSAKEGANRIHFQIGKIGKTDVCLCDSKYAQASKIDKHFAMNNDSISNSRGWINSTMRCELLGTATPTSPDTDSLMATLPLELRVSMKSVTKYTDNEGYNSDHTAGYAPAVTASQDYLFLLAEFEVFGTRTRANRYEQDNQAQYDYYRAGNGKIKNSHYDTSKAMIWWTRSAAIAGSQSYCTVDTAGKLAWSNANTSYGISPCFCV